MRPEDGNYDDGEPRLVVSDGTLAVGGEVLPPGVYRLVCDAIYALSCGRILQRWRVTEMTGVEILTTEAADEILGGCGDFPCV